MFRSLKIDEVCFLIGNQIVLQMLEPLALMIGEPNRILKYLKSMKCAL